MTDSYQRSALDLSPYTTDQFGGGDVAHQLAAAAAAVTDSADASMPLPRVAPAVAPDAMRFRMMAFGGQLTLMMVGKQMTPESLATALPTDPQLVLNLMCGAAPDVSVVTLDRIANHLGGAFVFGWMPQKQPAA
jgi:hypothetical protein